MPFNRTTVECKLISPKDLFPVSSAFNRTTVECKLQNIWDNQ